MKYFSTFRRLSVLILFLTVSYLTFAQVADNSSGNLVTVTPQTHSPAKEVVERRDLFTKHYRNNDGTFTAVISAVPVHYFEGGKFLDINTEIHTALTGSYPFSNTANLMKSYFSAYSSGGLMSVSKEGTISEFLNTRMYWEKNGTASGEVHSSDVAAAASGSTLTYGNLYTGMDAQFSISAGKRELNYIINNASALTNAPAGAQYLVFAEDIQLETGWNYEVKEKGIYLTDATGKTVGRYENPVVREGLGTANSARTADRTVTDMKVVKNGNTLTVLTRVSAEWLKDAARVFPIAIDPTFTISTPTEFGYTNSNGSDAGYDEVDFGKVSSLRYLGYASFNISSWNNALWTATKVSIGGISGTTGGTIHNLAKMALLRVTVYPGNYSTWASYYTAVNGMAAYNEYAKGNWTGTKDLGAAAVTQFGVDYASSYKWFTVGFKATGTWNNNSYAAITGAPLQLLVDYTVNGSCVAGTASPASQFVFTNGTANMTLSGYTAPGGIQWEYSPNGSSGWVNVSGGSGATTASYTTASLANGSYYYRARVTDGGSCTQYSNNAYVIVAANPPYCSGTGSGNAVLNNHIDGILFHEFNQQPGYVSANYTDYTDTTVYGKATVVAGQYHHFGATIRAQGSGVNSTTVAAWIDFNYDGVFNNTPFSSGGERIDLQNFTSAVANTYAAYLTIPANAHVGAVRMRVRAVRGSFADLDPCTTYTSSQTKDLTVVILPSIGNQPCVTPPSNVNGTVDVVKANSTTDKVYISRVKVDGPSGTVLDNNSQYFGVQAGSTITEYNYSNMMGYYSRGLTFEAGGNYTVTVEHSGYTCAAGVFIDWNGDGDFDDANEKVSVIADPNANPFIFNFTAPTTGIVDGKQVAMRVRLRYDDGSTYNLATAMNGCNNLTADGLQMYSEVEDYRATLKVPVLVCAPVANLAAAIGTVANGAAHHLTVSWSPISGATGYHLEYSTDGITYGNQVTVASSNYDFNAGDNPNKPYWFRVRATDGVQTCAWSTTASPRYTACDVPAVPAVSNLKTNSLDIAIATETPVANPAITTYSIYCATTSQYVQANGTLGATEVFQTKAQWGTLTVTGLTLNTQYCFNAKAKNADGDTRGGMVGVTTVEPFESDVINNQSSPPTNVWGSPGTCTSGGWFDYNASAGCGGSGGAKFSKTTDNFYLGCFLRTPVFNATGMNAITVSFDITNHLDAGDNIDFSCWSVGDSKYSGSTTTINGVAATKLNFDVARNCTRVIVEFSLAGFSNKSQMMFYINNNGDNDNGTYNLVIDNFSVNTLAPTTCATTLNCVDPSASAGMPLAVCSNAGALNITSGATASNYAGINWTSSGTGSWTNQTSLTQASYTPSNADITAGSVTLTLTATNGGCTPAVSNKTLTINTAPVASFANVANPVCYGYTGNTYTAQPGFNSYVWNVDGGTITSGGGSGDNTATVTWTVVGTKPISVNYSDANNCTASSPAVQNVTVHPLPEVSVTPTAAVCTGTRYSTLTASVNNGGTYQWSPNLYVVSTNGVNNVPITVEISQLTFYTVTGTSVNNCTASKVVPVATVPVGGVVTPRYSIICSGGSKALTADSTAGNSYQWQSSPDGNSNWTSIGGATGTSYTATPGADTHYRLIARSNACWDVTSNTALVNVSQPDITLAVAGKTDNSIVLNWTPVGGGNYNIAYNGTSSGSASAVTPPYTISGLTANGSYNITVTQTGAGLSGCPASGDTLGVTTLCSVPTGVTVSSPANKQLKVEWTGDAGSTYRVYYRALSVQNAYSFKDVTIGNNNGSATIAVSYGSVTYEVYVVRLNCPNPGDLGQKSALYNTIVKPLSACTPEAVINNVISTCSGQIEVSMSNSPTGDYVVYIQRLTPTVAGAVKYNVSGGTFQIHVGQAGQTFAVGVASKCASGTGNIVMWPGGITIKPLCAPVTNLVLSNPTCRGFTASWNKDICTNNSVANYQLFMKRTGTLTWNSYPVASQPSPFSPYLKVSWLGKGYEMSCYVKSNYTCNGYVIGGPSSTVEMITTLSAGCREEEESILEPETPSTQIIAADNSEAISIYPNPNNGQFTLDISRLSNDAVEVRTEVMNVLGQTVLTRISEAADGHGNEIIHLPGNCAAGTYFVRVTVGSNIYTAKVNVSR